jgi:DNA modification methylase
VSDNGKITWTNETRKLSELVPWPRNPRQIRKEQVERLQDSLDEFGQPETIAIGPGNEIYNGHQRLKSWADKFGDIDVDVRVASRELSEKEREKLTVFLHKGAAGEWDFDVLANEFEVDDLLDWGFDEHDLDLDLWGVEEPEPDPGAQIDRAEELRELWGVESGQLWRLGEHRLICGDCTDAESINRLFDIGFDSHFNLMLTDPPYNTNFDGKYDEVYTATKGVNTIDETQEWDADFVVTEKALPLHLKFGSVDVNYYIFCGWYPFWRYVFPFFHDQGENWAAKPFIWCKTFALSNVRQTSTANATEPIVMAYKKGHLYNANRGKENYDYIVMASNEGGRSGEHPTAKPLALFEHLMKMGSSEDNVVFDPFLGSGTTLIACERLGRKCRAVEISPAYCAVAIQRWVDMTGGEPELVTE